MELLTQTLDLKRWVQSDRRNSPTWKVIVVSVVAVVKQRPRDLKGPQKPFWYVRNRTPRDSVPSRRLEKYRYSSSTHWCWENPWTRSKFRRRFFISKFKTYVGQWNVSLTSYFPLNFCSFLGPRGKKWCCNSRINDLLRDGRNAWFVGCSQVEKNISKKSVLSELI